MVSIDPKAISVQRLHHFLLAGVSPRPIALASTMDQHGQPNVAPFSFFNVFSANPPILIFSPARSGRTNETKDTLKNVLEHPEVVINMVDYSMVEQISLASSPFERGVNEFTKAGLTPLASEIVQPYRVAESPVQLECKVNEIIALGNEGGAGNLVVCEVVKMHIDERVLDEDGMIDSLKIDLVSRMGGDWYCRADATSMFEIKKPITTVGIGFDQLPTDILQSPYLSPSDLAKLAGIESLPNETDVNEFKLIELSEYFVSLVDEPSTLEKELHLLAKEKLNENKLEDAWKVLLSFNN
ncbi:MAG: flavin reductase family protein [Flavobacteriales bacterium]|jgi:flavin reductase (DIM6/NTAB) family NADH-FMN oxidoreductase RutF